MVKVHLHNTEFEILFNSNIKLVEEIKDKLERKHKVYESDLIDALGDPYWVILRSKRKSPFPNETYSSKGVVYDIYCATVNDRVMFVVGRLFPDGNLYIITSYWADEDQREFYFNESEVLRNE